MDRFADAPGCRLSSGYTVCDLGNCESCYSFSLGWWWIVHRAPARQNHLDALKNATQLGEFALAQRLLVIRAIDDEASLTLALGAIVNYVTARSITYVLLLYLSRPSFFQHH